MKKFYKPLFLLSIPLVLAGCTTARTDVPEPKPAQPIIEQPKETTTQKPKTETKAQNPMANMPCHEMPDGSLMGDCPTDENGNPYLPDTALNAEAAMKNMDDMPCHKMPDGSLMGDCPVDEFGNPYVPKKTSGDHADDPNAAAHLHEDDHEHAEDVAPHRH